MGTNPGPAPGITDAATAVTVLDYLRKSLERHEKSTSDSMRRLIDLIVAFRPQPLLTVHEMGEAVHSDRNYIDSVWSKYRPRPVDDEGNPAGQTGPTRVVVNGDPAAAREAYDILRAAADQYLRHKAREDSTRAERNRALAYAYGAKILKPSVIAGVTGMDRNHVLRIARRLGVPPAHRPGTRNQHSAPAPEPTTEPTTEPANA